jgi:hypothetical protein
VRVWFYLENRERTFDSLTDKGLLSVTAFADELERERICYQRRKINVSQVFAGQTVGVKQVDDHLWLVTFMHYDLRFRVLRR